MVLTAANPPTHAGIMFAVRAHSLRPTQPKRTPALITPAALTEAMQRAMVLYHEDPAKIREMQRQAVVRIHERHTWKMVMKQYLQLYKEAKDGNEQVFIDN